MSIPLTSELSGAIEDLYETFQHYALPTSVQGCPCCHSVDSDRPLYSRPLRKLRPEDLEDYTYSALLTWGGLEDFKHFLPRIFEIAVSSDRFSFADPEIVFAKLDYGDWQTWPRNEHEAVQNFLIAVWCAVVEIAPSEELHDEPEIADWLCILAQTRGDLSPYLDRWLDRTIASPNAAWNLGAVIYRTCLPQPRPQGLNPFWRNHMGQVDAVSKWLHTENVRSALEKATEIYINEAFAEELIAAQSAIS